MAPSRKRLQGGGSASGQGGAAARLSVSSVREAGNGGREGAAQDGGARDHPAGAPHSRRRPGARDPPLRPPARPPAGKRGRGRQSVGS
uniref:Uncharacterized protein n=1 Tax=Sphaerodactylus townsendi TaxID=933632 RepID=A0ACB8FLW6_9SAUR